jgi:hypothetical protein
MTQTLVYLFAAACVVVVVASLKPTRVNLALALAGVIALFALLAVASNGPGAIVAVLDVICRLFGR